MRQTLHEATGRLEFSFENDFNPDFIKDIKAQIAPQYRDYDPESHIWTIHKPAWPVYRAIYKRHFIGEDQMELL